MDPKKQAEFVSKMRLNKKKPKFFSGGVVPHYDLGGTVSGALGGASTGAAIGSIVPGIGTAIGAIGGGIAGLIGGLFGGGGPQQPNITDPVTGQQITDANGNVVASQAQLQSFATALNGVNGPQNQQAVLTQLQGVANGTGPNPAKAELAQATGQNVQQQTAMAAGQRGASGNVGLLERQAAQTGSAIQQGSTGQAATLQANQSLNALNSEGAIAGQQVNETQAAESASNAAVNQNQSTLLNAQTGYNTQVTGGQASVNSAAASTANNTQNNLTTLARGAASGAGVSTLPNSANGVMDVSNAPTGNPVSGVGAQGPTAPGSATGIGANSPTFARGGKVVDGPHNSHVANYLAQGGKTKKVPSMVSAKEVYLSPEAVRKVVEQGANPMKVGEHIKGKAKVAGDSLKNDTIHKDLDEGGIVIPRHITTHKMAAEKAELFVHRALARKKAGK